MFGINYLKGFISFFLIIIFQKRTGYGNAYDWDEREVESKDYTALHADGDQTENGRAPSPVHEITKF